MSFLDKILNRRPVSNSGHPLPATPNQFEVQQPPQETPRIVYSFFTDAKATQPHTVRATLSRNFSDTWPYKPDFLAELKKSHPECHFDNAATPSAVIFTHNSAVTFEQAFKAFKSNEPQASVTI